MAENGANNKKLTAPQRRAIAALLTERNIREAAKVAKVAERTLTRWLTEPLFVAELRQAEGELLDAATRRLLGMQDSALDELASIVSTAEDDAVRLRAALGVLTHLLKMKETRDFEARIAALEAAIEQK